MRFDVVLHGLRLFRSRTQATTAIERGDAQLNGGIVKPSRDAKPGDRVTLREGSGTRTLEILALPTRSLSRDAAREHVREITPG